MKFFRAILFFLYSLLCGTKLAAQPGSYMVKHYGEDEGLTQNQVNCIIPDKNGFLLVATEGGINRFTGNSFFPVEFAQHFAGANSLSRIKWLFKKGADTILAYSQYQNAVATIVGNKIITVERMDAAKHGLLFPGESSPLPCPRFLKAAADSFIANNTAGLAFGFAKDTFAFIAGEKLDFFTDKGLYSSFKIPGYKIAQPTVFKLGLNIVSVDKDNQLVFYTPNGISKKIQPPFSKQYSKILWCTDLSNKSIFIIADNDLLQLTFSEKYIPKITLLFTDPEIQKRHCREFWIKDSNIIVAITTYNGMYVYKKNHFNITPKLEPEDLNVFYSQLLLSDDKTILANNYHFKDNEITGKQTSVLLSSRYCNLRDHLGNYWDWDNSKQELFKYDKNFKHPKTVLTNIVNLSCLYEDRENRIWVGMNEQFVYVTQKGLKTLNFPLSQQAISPERAQSISQDKNNNYFIATNKGLYRYAPNTADSLTAIKELSGYDIRFIKYDDDENIWACTYGGGLFLIHQGKITQFLNLHHSLTYVHAIIEDKRGNFWMPTNNGLLVASRNSLLSYAENGKEKPFFYRFTKQNGFRTNEFNGGGSPAYLQLADGLVSLPSMDGLVSFKPDSFRLEFSGSPIMVEKILLDTVTANENNEPLVVDSKTKMIAFSIATSFWGDAENNQLEYQVVEVKRDPSPQNWIPVDNSMLISVLSPGYGDYKLLLRKRINLESDGFLYKTVDFNILPKWYQTPVFYILFIALIFGGITGIYEWRFRMQNKQKKRLENEIRLATAEIKTANDELKFQNNTKAKLISIFTHDISIPLQYIFTALNQQAKKLNTGAALKNDLSEIARSTGQLLLLSNNMLTWIRTQQKNQQFKPQKENFLISELFAEKWQLLDSTVKVKKITLINNLAPGYTIYSDRNILGIIIYNLLSNALKFTQNGTITVAVEKSGNQDLLQITDTGKGMPADQLEKINNFLSVTPGKGTSGEPGRGIGLLLVKELAGMLAIGITIESTPGYGTKVTLALPSSDV